MVINNPTNTMTMIPPISRSKYMHSCVMIPQPIYGDDPTNITRMIPPISWQWSHQYHDDDPTNIPIELYAHTCVLGPMPGLPLTTGDLVIAPQVIEMHWIRIWSNWFRCQEMYRDISVTFNSMDTWSDRFTFHGMHDMNEIKYMQWDIHHWPKCKFRHDLCYDGQSIVTEIV